MDTTTSKYIVTLAPIGVASADGRIIDSGCTIASTRVALVAKSIEPLSQYTGDRPIGTVKGFQESNGYIIAHVTLHEGETIPDGALPTFDLHYNDRRQEELDGDGVKITFHSITVTCVRVGYTPMWEDPAIGFHPSPR